MRTIRALLTDQSYRLFRLGIGLCLVFLTIDIIFDVLYFHTESILDQILSPSLYEMVIRFSVIVVILIFASYAQILTWRLQINQRTLEQELVERKRTEVALRESEERYRLLVDSSPYGMSIHQDGKVAFVNQAAVVQMRATSAEELIGKPIHSFVHPETWDATRSRVQRMLQGEPGMYPVEDRYVRLDGSIFPVQVTAAPFTFKGRTAIQIIALDISARKQAEEAAHRLDFQVRLILEAAGEGILGLNAAGAHTFVNPMAAKILGYTIEELIGQPSHTLWHYARPDGKPYPVQECQIYTTLQDGRNHNGEEYFWRKDGSGFPVEFTSIPIREGEHVIGAVVTFRDITERKQAEKAMRDSEERYRLLFERHPLPMWVLDPISLRFLAVNDVASKHYGYSRAEFLAMSIWDIRPIEDISRLEENLSRTLQHQERTGFWKHRKKDGTLIDVEIISHAVTFLDQPARLVLANDVTARKQAEAALHESERFARATVDALSAEIAILDETGTIIAVNQAWRAFAAANTPPGMQAQVAEGTNYLAVCEQAYGPNAEEAPTIADGIHAVMNGEQEEFWLEYPCSSPNEQRWFNVRVTRFPNAGPLRIVVAHENITLRKRVEAALLEERALLEQRVAERTIALTHAAQLKDEFLASMSHELRTPLTAVLGITEALQEEIYGPITERQRASLQRIVESGNHLLALINDILDVAKIGAGTITLEYDSVLIESLCQASLRMIREAALKKKLTVKSAIDPAVTFLSADTRRLKQILANLLSNAVKFTPIGGSIGLEVVGDVSRQAVDLTVWDSGIGIAQQDLGRLFQPFVQLDSRLARQYNGTGLGLTLVYQMAELHGGSVRVASEPGVGSRFTVSLPWQVPQHEAMHAVQMPPTTIEKPSTLIRQTILLAEDNETSLATLTEYLEVKGYRILAARTGMEAIAQAYTAHPALILMDIQMPGMDGLEAIQRIRAKEDMPYIPIIALTALAMPGDRERCLAVGADEYLSKPISLKELAATINDQLHKADSGILGTSVTL
jgi:PAS domain S-box-containing protein